MTEPRHTPKLPAAGSDVNPMTLNERIDARIAEILKARDRDLASAVSAYLKAGLAVSFLRGGV